MESGEWVVVRELELCVLCGSVGFGSCVVVLSKGVGAQARGRGCEIVSKGVEGVGGAVGARRVVAVRRTRQI